jgi:hypothetical protein
MNLEAEIRDLAARRDIQKAVFAYMRGQDRLDHALQMTAFHDDADVDCGLVRGDPQAYTDFAQGFLATMKGSQHLIGQMDIEVDADAGTASGEIYFFAWHRLVEENGDFDLFMAGRYIDDYTCKDGKWAIQRRRELIDWARKDEPSDSFMEGMPLVHLPGPRGQDFSQTRDWASGTSGR